MPYVKDADIHNKDLGRYLNNFQVALDFNLPYFDRGIEYALLTRGRKPACLDATYNKIMINMAHAMIQDRLPKWSANVFGSDDFISLEAERPELELTRPGVEAWLRNMFKNPAKLNIIADIIPTFQSVGIFGNGYRIPCVRKDKDGKSFITVRDVDYFQILLMPDGGLINPIDRYAEEAMSSFFHIDWMRRKQIEDTFSKYEGYDKDAAARLFANEPNVNATLDTKYRNTYQVIGGVLYGTKDDWRQRMVGVDGKDARYRIVNWYMRDEWWVVAEDNFIIYKGKNPMGNGLLPLVNYMCTPDFKNSHGIGAIEMSIDLIYAMLMNFGYRMDWLGKLMFPTQYIRKDLLEGRTHSSFLQRPYGVIPFNSNIKDISNALFVDRMPEITPQSFQEEANMQRFIQSVSGFPDISKGMVGPGEKGGATGIVTAVKQAGARIDAESLCLEANGVEQEGRLLLTLAHENVIEDEMVRDNSSANGFGWTNVDANTITSGYVCRCKGTRFLSNKSETFQRLLALYPLMSADPNVDKYELSMELADAADLPHRDRIFRKPETQSMTPGMGKAGEPGGLAAGQNLHNRTRSVQNRNQTQPNTGALLPAGQAM